MSITTFFQGIFAYILTLFQDFDTANIRKKFQIQTKVYSFLPLQRYHRIHPAVVVLVAGDAEGAEDGAEAVGAHLLHQAGVDAVQVFVDVGGAEHLGLLALEGQAVVAEEEFFHGLAAAEAAVAALVGEHVVAQLVLLAQQGFDLWNGETAF